MHKPHLAIVLALFILTPSFSQAALAQARMSASQIEELEQHVKDQYAAFQRFALAEQEAKADGNNDFATRYHEAAVKAREAYSLATAQLQKARESRHSQDPKALPVNDYR